MLSSSCEELRNKGTAPFAMTFCPRNHSYIHYAGELTPKVMIAASLLCGLSCKHCASWHLVYLEQADPYGRGISAPAKARSW